VRYDALAADYDGTLASDSRVDDATIQSLEELRRTGRRLILVTGRRLDDLQRVFPRTDLFERIVAENGAVVHAPGARDAVVLGEPPPPAFLDRLRERGVAPLEPGRVIVATSEPHETAVIEAIRDLGLELQVIFNKGSVMVLPSGINKAAGLLRALRDLRLSRHNVVGIGDAENDHAFLEVCECAVAVANALPMLKERADLVTQAAAGAGVAELIRALIDSDLREVEPRLGRHHVLLGRTPEGESVAVPPYGVNVLLAGTSGSGKSTLTQGFLERLAQQRYQYCVIDPEGDYASLQGAVVLGDSKRIPGVEEVINLLEDPSRNGVANLLGVPMAHRPEILEALLGAISDLRTRTGHPHWVILDEAHHVLPAAHARAPQSVPRRMQGAFLITVHPDEMAAEVVKDVGLMLAVGRDPAETLARFARIIGARAPKVRDTPLEPGEAIAWRPADGRRSASLFQVAAPEGERRRHRRKYTEGELGPDRSFFFRGPNARLNLRAQNLSLFNQIAEGVDDETWLFHLHQGDYSRWFREAIKDLELAREAEAIEKDEALGAERSRARIREAIQARYTAPAESPR
jgi:hydroxymethylpyrimidine pyrophosphatase-like HAD family hydrolase